MIARYDARRNVHAVAAPAQVRDHGMPLSADAVRAARSRMSWARSAVDALCARARESNSPAAKPHRTDGLREWRSLPRWLHLQ